MAFSVKENRAWSSFLTELILIRSVIGKEKKRKERKLQTANCSVERLRVRFGLLAILSMIANIVSFTCVFQNNFMMY